MQQQNDTPFDLKLALCISLFSFSNYVTQPIYSAFVPVLLADRLATTAQVGLVLSLCNFLAMLIHPMIGALSDQTRCRFGRRRPYILSGAVACGISFALIPWLTALWQWMLVLAFYSLAVAYWRAPVSAIMIDRVPPRHITRSNAVASCMLALASVFAYLSSNRMSASGTGLTWIFALGGASAVVMAAVGCATVQESDSRGIPSAPSPKRGGMGAAFLSLPRRQRLCFAATLLVVAFAYIGNSSFEYFFVLFAMERLGVSSGGATLYLALTMVAYFLGSLFISCTRRTLSEWAMVSGTLAVAGGALLAFFLLLCGPGGGAAAAFPVCLLYGLCWGCFNICMYPLLLRFNTGGHSGNLMGLYFVCTGLAGSLSPTLFGLLHDFTGTYVSLFAFCGAMFALALGALAVSRRLWEQPVAQSPLV